MFLEGIEAEEVGFSRDSRGGVFFFVCIDIEICFVALQFFLSKAFSSSSTTNLPSTTKKS